MRQELPFDVGVVAVVEQQFVALGLESSVQLTMIVAIRRRLVFSTSCCAFVKGSEAKYIARCPKRRRG